MTHAMMNAPWANGTITPNNGNPGIVGRIVLVLPRFTQWSGMRAMHEGDYTIGAGGKMPPKEVAKSLGLKAIIDPQELRVFDRIKTRAEALLEAKGVRFLTGWAVPQDKAKGILQSLDGIVTQYEKAKADFLSRYDGLVSDWAARHPEYAKEIEEGRLDASAVAERISAGYATFRLQPVSDERSEALEKSVSGLADDLIRSVSRAAMTYYRQCIVGKNSANLRSIQALLRMRERLDGLAFLSAGITPIVDEIDAVVASLPKQGYFDGEAFHRFSALVATIGNEELLREFMRTRTNCQTHAPVAQDAPAVSESSPTSVGLSNDAFRTESVTAQAAVQPVSNAATLDIESEASVESDSRTETLPTHPANPLTDTLPVTEPMPVSDRSVADETKGVSPLGASEDLFKNLETLLRMPTEEPERPATQTTNEMPVSPVSQAFPTPDTGEGLYF